MKKVRVLVVDDSATIRGLLTATLSRDPEIEVVGGAGDPLEARELIKTLNPDVLTLGVEMPKMSGIEFLEKIMRLRPMPVIMCSTLTQAGAAITVEALELGAFDAVGKPHFDDLPEKIKAASRARVRPLSARPPPAARNENYRPSSKVLAIGSSTGGVEALCQLLVGFPENCPATLITQHMPPTFTASFAARLDGEPEQPIIGEFKQQQGVRGELRAGLRLKHEPDIAQGFDSKTRLAIGLGNGPRALVAPIADRLDREAIQLAPALLGVHHGQVVGHALLEQELEASVLAGEDQPARAEVRGHVPGVDLGPGHGRRAGRARSAARFLRSRDPT